MLKLYQTYFSDELRPFSMVSTQSDATFENKNDDFQINNMLKKLPTHYRPQRFFRPVSKPKSAARVLLIYLFDAAARVLLSYYAEGEKKRGRGKERRAQDLEPARLLQRTRPTPKHRRYPSPRCECKGPLQRPLQHYDRQAGRTSCRTNTPLTEGSCAKHNPQVATAIF